ncbi:MAG: radical SAM protein [Pseudobdellovibrio sp.]
MNNRIWLINLFGNPCAPSAFHPDNSLAALAAGLKDSGYRPLIIDMQTVSISARLCPPEFGQQTSYFVELAQKGTLSKIDLQDIANFNQMLSEYEVKVIDEIANELLEKEKDDLPLFVGMKLYSGAGSALSRRLAMTLKKSLHIPFIGGGPLIRAIGKKYLEFYSEFDYLIDGEADRAIVQFAKMVQAEINPSEVPGLIFRDSISNTIYENPFDLINDISQLPDPCYDKDVYPSLYEDGEKLMIFQLDESRGCPNKCNFCLHPSMNGRIMRVIPPERIINQIKYLQSEFGAFAFRFTGSNTPKRFLKKFAELVKQENLNIQYSCFASINTTDESIIDALKESGLVGVFIGVETVDQEILNTIFNKFGQPLEKVENLLTAFMDKGIFTTTSWIYPMPNSNLNVRENTRAFISKIYKGRPHQHGSAILIPSGLMPRTEWFNNRKKYGFEILDLEKYYRSYAELSFRLFLPRQLLGSWHFTLQEKTFDDLAAECDSLERDLINDDVCLGVSDEWNLASNLSGYSMKDFREKMSHCFVQADYNEIRKIILTINANSRNHSQACDS